MNLGELPRDVPFPGVPAAVQQQGVVAGHLPGSCHVGNSAVCPQLLMSLGALPRDVPLPEIPAIDFFLQRGGVAEQLAGSSCRVGCRASKRVWVARMPQLLCLHLQRSLWSMAEGRMAKVRQDIKHSYLLLRKGHAFVCCLQLLCLHLQRSVWSTAEGRMSKVRLDIQQFIMLLILEDPLLILR